MKIFSRKNKVNKGMSSALILSVLIHAGLFLLAGVLVVFTVVKQKEVEFETPKAVERPKMKLKKPKVRVKKTSKPKQTDRIVSTVNRNTMPVIDLPEISGMGDGLGDGFGGFELMPELGEVNIFGAGVSIGNDFKGTFYDIKRDRTGRNLPIPDRYGFLDILNRLMKSRLNRSVLRKYYRSPQELYTTIFAMPPDLSLVAPWAFGEYDTVGYFWLVIYEGKLVHHEDITFRFWGSGDDVLAVKVNGEFVLISSNWSRADSLENYWHDRSADSEKYPLGNRLSVVGDWITLKAGEPLDMEVLMAEIPGGNFQAILCVEVEGEEYPQNPYRNGPCLPVFKTEEPSVELAEKIQWGIHEGDCTVTNGPVFRDYAYASDEKSSEKTAEEETESEVEIREFDPFRLWSPSGSKPFRAEFVMEIGGKAVLKTKEGSTVRLDLRTLSDEDLAYIDLETPPEFKINFRKQSWQVPPPEQPPNTWYREFRMYDYKFGVTLERSGVGNYNHDLKLEYYVVADEVDGNNFLLLERNAVTITPDDFQERKFDVRGEKKRLKRQQILPTAPMRGYKYGKYLVTLTDVRGEVLQYATSNEFLYDYLGNLQSVDVGRHFNSKCITVGPPRPGPDDRPPGL